MQTVYEVLGVAPTNHFRILKKAYFKKAMQWHPDKNSSNPEQAEANFKILQNVWDYLDSEEKAISYHKWFESCSTKPNYTEKAPGFSHASQPFGEDSSFTNFSQTNTMSTDGIRIFNERKQRIFIPVDIDYLTTMESFGQAWTPDVFEHLANSLQQMSNNRYHQFGIDFNEAKEIINQHSHRNGWIIVEVCVRLADIMEGKKSESGLNPGLLNGGSNSYFWLLNDTKFSAENIISFAPLLPEDYQNTLRAGFEIGCPLLDWPGLYNPAETKDIPRNKNTFSKVRCLETIDSKAGRVDRADFFLLNNAPTDQSMSELNSKILSLQAHPSLETSISSMETPEKHILLPPNNISLAINDILVKIQDLYNYGKELNKKDETKGKVAVTLAKKLCKMVKESTLDEMNYQAFEQFTNTFLLELHSKDSYMIGEKDAGINSHREQWKPIIANIALALTGIGLLLQLGKLIMAGCSSKPFTLNRAFFFMQTQREQKVDAVEAAFEQFEGKKFSQNI